MIFDTACPKCQDEGRDSAEDNLRIFDDGGQYCCAGHGWIGRVKENIKFKHDNVYMLKKQEKVNMTEFKTGIYADIQSRKLKKKTCEFYGYQVIPGTKEHIANYYDAAGNVIMQQIRTPDKQFPLIGDKNASSNLFGGDKFTPNDNVFVTITEGALDCLSVAQVFDCKYPIISLPNGAGAAGRVIEKHKQWLEGFKYVVLAFDNDEPGRKATEDCIKILEPGKVRIAKWGKYKDANEALQAGDEAFIRNAIYSASVYTPEAIKTGEDLVPYLKNHKRETVPWPWKKLNGLIGEIEMGRVYIFASRPGVGKTELAQGIINHFIKQKQTIGLIPLEQPLSEVILKTHDKSYGTRFNDIANEDLSEEIIQQCKENVLNHLVLYDVNIYGSSLTEMKNNIPHMSRSFGCKVLIYDNLSFSAGASGENDWKQIDETIIMLKALAVKYNFAFIVVCHLNRRDEIDGEPAKPHENDIKGSQGVEQFTDCVLGLWRDTKAENQTIRNTLEIWSLKDRMTGQSKGKMIKLPFNQKKGIIEE